MGGTCSAYGERIGVYCVLVGKREGKRPRGKPRRRKWEVGVWTESSWLRIGTGGGQLRLR